MNNAFLSGSRPRDGARQRSAITLSSSSLQLRSSASRSGRSVSSIAALAIVLLGLLVGAAVIDREQQIQIKENHGRRAAETGAQP